MGSATSNALPASGRLAGIDYGTVRIGIAVTDPERILASPYETYHRRGEAKDAEYFRQLVTQERLVGFVVGLPVHASGDESQKSHEARRFGAWLHNTTDLPLVFYDERYTSSLAEAQLQEAGLTKKARQARIDKLAAQLILIAYLESPQRAEAPTALED